MRIHRLQTAALICIGLLTRKRERFISTRTPFVTVKQTEATTWAHKREAMGRWWQADQNLQEGWGITRPRGCVRTYFLDPEVSAASIDPADPDWRAWDWGRIALDDDVDDERGFPLRVSSTRADSATPSQPYLNQHCSCNALQGEWIVVVR